MATLTVLDNEGKIISVCEVPDCPKTKRHRHMIGCVTMEEIVSYHYRNNIVDVSKEMCRIGDIEFRVRK